MRVAISLRQQKGHHSQLVTMIGWACWALLFSSCLPCCIAKRAWESEEFRPQSPLQPHSIPEQGQQGVRGRALRQEEWTGEVKQLPGVNPPGVQHLIQHPRKFKPPEANYTVIHSTEEYVDLIDKATGTELYIRFHESLLFMDVGATRTGLEANIGLAANVTVVLDCQGGAIISDPNTPFPKPSEGSFFDGYGCVWYGNGNGDGGLAAQMRLSDLWLLYPCSVESDDYEEQPSQITVLLTQDGPVHFEASDSAWFGIIEIEMRNVTMSCADSDEIQREMVLIQEDAGIPVEAGLSSDDTNAGRTVPVWAIVVLVAGASALVPPTRK